jgi:uncharacterized membrane protein YqgA involved in biofilm formation
MPHFDGTITLGNALTIALILGGFIAQWVRFGAKLEKVEEWIKEHQKCGQKQDDILKELGEAIAFMRGALGIQK